GPGVEEAQAVGVQRLAGQEGAVLFGGEAVDQVAEVEAVAAAVELVGEDGVADAGEVDPDLVGPAGAGLDAAVGVAGEALDRLVVGAGVLGVLVVVADGHLDAVAGVVGDFPLYVVAVPVEHAGGQGDVLLEDLAEFELQRQLAVGLLLLGDQDGAAGVAVEAVDDAGAVVAVVVAEVVEAEAQGVDERAAPVPLGGVDDHVGGLVDDGEVLVLVEDLEVDVLGDRLGARRLGRGDADDVAVADAVAGLGGLAVDL